MSFLRFIFFPKSWLIRASLNKKLVEPVNSDKKIGKIDRTLFVLSNFYLFLEELAHKSWPNKKLVEPISSGRKIGNGRNDAF
ncbi:hypothetical protein, partial [Carnobacterium maltaromaticum]|uniref:hypothetical protein n=1 Tax=Carnobacterium maltaromaticum TaxID=2751 RepID=UPI001F1DCDA4